MNEKTIAYLIITITLPLVAFRVFYIIRKNNLFNINAVKLSQIDEIPKYCCPKCSMEMEKGFSRTNGIAKIVN